MSQETSNATTAPIHQQRNNGDSDKATQATVAIDIDAKHSNSTTPKALSATLDEPNANILAASDVGTQAIPQTKNNLNLENEQEEEFVSQIVNESLITTPAEWLDVKGGKCSADLSCYIQRFRTFEKVIVALERYGNYNGIADSLERAWKRQMGPQDFQILENFFDYAQEYVDSM